MRGSTSVSNSSTISKPRDPHGADLADLRRPGPQAGRLEVDDDVGRVLEQQVGAERPRQARPRRRSTRGARRLRRPRRGASARARPAPAAARRAAAPPPRRRPARGAPRRAPRAGRRRLASAAWPQARRTYVRLPAPTAASRRPASRRRRRAGHGGAAGRAAPGRSSRETAGRRVRTAYDYPGWLRRPRRSAAGPIPGWLEPRAADPLEHARTLLGTPYLWGGMTSAASTARALST